MSVAVVGNVVTLDGSASSDVDGLIASFEFTIDGVPQPPQVTATLDHVFVTAGTHAVDLVVIDDLGASSAPASAAIDIVVGPIVRIDVTGPATVGSGETVDFTSEAFDAFDNLVFTRVVSYEGAVDLGPAQVCDTEGDIVGCLDIEVIVGPLHHVTVTASKGTINIDHHTQLTPRGFDVNEHEVVDLVFTWTTTRGIIRPDGDFNSTNAGIATVRASSGGFTGSIAIRVTPTLPTTVTIDSEFPIADAVTEGVSGSLHVRFIDGPNAGGATVKVFFTDPLGATSAALEVTTDASGVASFTSGSQLIPGQYTVSVSSTAGPNYGAAARTYVVYVADPGVI